MKTKYELDPLTNPEIPHEEDDDLIDIIKPIYAWWNTVTKGQILILKSKKNAKKQRNDCHSKRSLVRKGKKNARPRV